MVVLVLVVEEEEEATQALERRGVSLGEPIRLHYSSANQRAECAYK